MDDDRMDKKIAEHFLNKYVKLEKISDNFPDKRPFKLYGIIEDVTDDAILLQTDQQLGAILLRDIIRIVEWDDQK